MLPDLEHHEKNQYEDVPILALTIVKTMCSHRPQKVIIFLFIRVFSASEPFDTE